MPAPPFNVSLPAPVDGVVPGAADEGVRGVPVVLDHVVAGAGQEDLRGRLRLVVLARLAVVLPPIPIVIFRSWVRSLRSTVSTPASPEELVRPQRIVSRRSSPPAPMRCRSRRRRRACRSGVAHKLVVARLRRSACRRRCRHRPAPAVVAPEHVASVAALQVVVAVGPEQVVVACPAQQLVLARCRRTACRRRCRRCSLSSPVSSHDPAGTGWIRSRPVASSFPDRRDRSSLPPSPVSLSSPRCQPAGSRRRSLRGGRWRCRR